MKYFTLVEKKKSVTRGAGEEGFFYFSFFFAKYFGLLNLCSDLFAWPITPTIILNISKPKKTQSDSCSTPPTVQWTNKEKWRYRSVHLCLRIMIWVLYLFFCQWLYILYHLSSLLWFTPYFWKYMSCSNVSLTISGLISLIIDWFALVFISKFGVIPFISMSITFYCKYMSIVNLYVNVIFLMHLFSKIVYYVLN